MSIYTVSLVAFLAVVLLLAVAKRTRPLIMVVVSLWMILVAVLRFRDDEPVIAIVMLGVAAGVATNVYSNRRKYIAQLKG